MGNTLFMSEFIKSLIVSTLDGIIEGEIEAQKRVDEIKTSLKLSIDEFKNKFISDEDVKNELDRIFLESIGEILEIDMLYKKNNKEEYPPIYNITSYEMKDGDYYKWGEDLRISVVGYKNIFNTVGNNIAISKKYLLGQLINQGIPKIYIDKGEITAKLKIDDVLINRKMKEDFEYMRGMRFKLYHKDGTISEEGIERDFRKAFEFKKYYNKLVYNFYIDIPKSGQFLVAFIGNKVSRIYLNNTEVNEGDKEDNIIYLSKGINNVKLILKDNWSEDNKGYFKLNSIDGEKYIIGYEKFLVEAIKYYTKRVNGVVVSMATSIKDCNISKDGISEVKIVYNIEN